jgi:predicted acetyltransferase
MVKTSSRHKVTLEFPSWELRESYVECLKDFQKEDPLRPINWEWLKNFQLYLDWARREREGTNVDKGRVPQITYWIVCDGETAVGKLTLRPKLTPELEQLGGHFGFEIRPDYRKQGIASEAFRLGLREIKRLGTTEVVVTCDIDNLGSIGVLEKNGGKLIDTYDVPNWHKTIRKYFFQLK